MSNITSLYLLCIKTLASRFEIKKFKIYPREIIEDVAAVKIQSLRRRRCRGGHGKHRCNKLGFSYFCKKCKFICKSCGESKPIGFLKKKTGSCLVCHYENNPRLRNCTKFRLPLCKACELYVPKDSRFSIPCRNPNTFMLCRGCGRKDTSICNIPRNGLYKEYYTNGNIRETKIYKN